MNQYITLLLSFCLSTGAYILAQPDDVPVQHIEFDDYEIKGRLPVIEMNGHEIIAQVDESDDGDGANIDAMNAHWCDIWPDKCNVGDDDDEEQGGDEEEGC